MSSTLFPVPYREPSRQPTACALMRFNTPAMMGFFVALTGAAVTASTPLAKGWAPLPLRMEWK